MEPYLPTHFSRSLAARLCGLSRDAVDILCDNGVLTDTRAGKGWGRIPFSQVEKMHGRKITTDAYFSARWGAPPRTDQFVAYEDAPDDCPLTS